MKILKQSGNTMILCIIEVIAGILLLINPMHFTAAIIIAAGVALMVNGVLHVIRYFRSSPEEAAAGRLLMRGLVALLAGGFCAFNPGWFVAAFPVIAILYGIAVLIVGLSKVQNAMDMIRMKNAKWWWVAISAVISVACALVIISNPFSSTVVLWYFAGISLIVEAIFDLVTLIMGRKIDECADAE